MVEKLVPELFLKNQNLAYFLSLKFYTVVWSFIAQIKD